MAKKYQETIQNTNTFLSNFATGFKIANPVADFVSPPFQVKLEAGKYVEYNKTVFRIWDDKIKGSEEAKEIQWDVDEASYACEEYSMSKFVSDKAKEQSINPINLDIDAVKMLKRMHAQSREYRINAIAGNSAIVTQTSDAGGDWDTAASGTPVADILSALSTISVNAILADGVRFRGVFPIEVALKMITTDEWKEYFRYTENGFSNGLFDAIRGLRFIGVDPMITNLVGITTDKGTASDPTTASLWSDNVLLFYCEPNPTTETRTFMYSPYVYKDVIFTTRVPRRRGVYHDIYSDIDELLVDATCAYLYTNTL